jgi:hypothetical protein
MFPLGNFCADFCIDRLRTSYCQVPNDFSFFEGRKEWVQTCTCFNSMEISSKFETLSIGISKLDCKLSLASMHCLAEHLYLGHLQFEREQLVEFQNYLLLSKLEMEQLGEYQNYGYLLASPYLLGHLEKL